MDEFVTQARLADTDFVKGALLLVDKPAEWTSFDVVNKIRGTLRHVLNISKIKVGHAGTLDPMATGLLLICTGKWTTRLEEYQGLDKVYTGVMTLGAITASYDKETPEENHKPVGRLTENMIMAAVAQFVGEVDQVPPMYSAIKVEGKPLYQSARKGKQVEVKARKVHIHAFEITRVNLPHVSFTVHCSKGTYIRSLARDLGERLDCGAYLSGLRRTRIGPYRIEDAWILEDLIAGLKKCM